MQLSTTVLQDRKDRVSHIKTFFSEKPKRNETGD